MLSLLRCCQWRQCLSKSSEILNQIFKHCRTYNSEIVSRKFDSVFYQSHEGMVDQVHKAHKPMASETKPVTVLPSVSVLQLIKILAAKTRKLLKGVSNALVPSVAFF